MNEKTIKKFWDERANMTDYKHYESITEFNDSEEAEKRNTIELNELKQLKLPKDCIVLDLGCGTGRYSSELSPHCKEIIAVDYSKPMIELAKRLNSKPNITYICSNVTTFSSKTKFDLIIIAGLIVYLNDNSVDKLINNASKLLNKDGKIFVRSSVGIDSRFEITDKYSDELKSNYNAIYRTPAELHTMFIKHNLVPTKEKVLYQFRKETCQMQFIYEKERTVGILGGMGPYATLDLYKKIIDRNPSTREWEHPRIIIDSNTKIPSRTRAILYGEESPEQSMLNAINNLGNAGADFVVVACNSAHYFLSKPNVPVVSIMDVVHKRAIDDHIKKVGLLAGTVTIEKKLYEKVFSPKIKVILPKHQETVVSLIEKTKKGLLDKDTMEELIDELLKAGAEKVILGCTELPILVKDHSKVYNVNEIIADFIIAYAKRRI